MGALSMFTRIISEMAIPLPGDHRPLDIRLIPCKVKRLCYPAPPVLQYTDLIPSGSPHMEESLSYEDAVVQLEAIVKRLESDSTALDDSLSLFEEGVRLSRLCARKLDEVEKKVLVLMENRAGVLTTAPFEPAEG